MYLIINLAKGYIVFMPKHANYVYTTDLGLVQTLTIVQKYTFSECFNIGNYYNLTCFGGNI